MTEKEKLVKELHDLDYSLIGVDKVSDFILSDRKRVLDLVEKSLKELSENVTETIHNPHIGFDLGDVEGYVDGLLETIAKLKGE